MPQNTFMNAGQQMMQPVHIQAPQPAIQPIGATSAQPVMQPMPIVQLNPTGVMPMTPTGGMFQGHPKIGPIAGPSGNVNPWWQAMQQYQAGRVQPPLHQAI